MLQIAIISLFLLFLSGVAFCGMTVLTKNDSVNTSLLINSIELTLDGGLSDSIKRAELESQLCLQNIRQP
jgi:hypothetical protein